MARWAGFDGHPMLSLRENKKTPNPVLRGHWAPVNSNNRQSGLLFVSMTREGSEQQRKHDRDL